MNITKQKQIHGYRQQTSSFFWEEELEEWQDRSKGLRGTN